MTISATTQLETVNCSCGGIYAVQKSVYDAARRQGGGWNCPYCRGAISWRETENDALKRKLERAQQVAANERESARSALAEAEHFRRSRDGMKGQLVKVKKRVKAGVCPCCNRTFKQLAAHMERQHPDYVG